MSPEDRWRHLEPLLDAALDREPGERAGFLADACPDPALRGEVERLLCLAERTDSFLEAGAASFAAPLLRAGDGAEATPVEGMRLGPYRILREAGRGGMGVVYLAERCDGLFQRRVALKLVRDAWGVDDHLVRRFAEERQILAGLDHPGIARLLDGGLTEEGLPYLVMDYVEGVPLDRFCTERALRVEDRLRLFLRVCEAVQYAHGKLVIHRDLKPANILVSDGGAVTLLDFGIARLLEEHGEGLTQMGARMLTPECASPEQLRGEPLSIASDVYALGVLLYRLLAGRHPYASGRASAPEMMTMMAGGAPRPPSEAVRASGGARAGRRLRGDLDRITLRALAAEPERRYPTAAALAEDVGRHLAGHPVAARPDGWAYRTGKLLRRNPAASLAIGVLAALLVTFTGVTALQSRRIRIQSAEVAAERDRAHRVAEFMTEIFRASDPTQQPGRELSARALLDRGADRVERELADDPEARGAMADAIGRAYLMLGAYEPSQRLLDSALAVRRRLYPGDHPDLAATLTNVGYVLRNRGEFDASEARYREALAMRRRLGDDASPEVISATNGLAYLLRGRGRFQDAAELYREALRNGRRTLGPRHAEVGLSLHGLATSLAGLGRFREAEPLMREAVNVYREVHGEQHVQVAIALQSLGSLLREEGRLAEAERAVREGMAIRRSNGMGRHPLFGNDLAGLAGILRDRGALREADSLYREALEIQRASLAPGHERIAFALSGLGATLVDLGRPGEAEPMLREALETMRGKLDPTHPQIAEAELALGSCLARLGRAPEAVALLQRAESAARALTGPNGRVARRARQELEGLNRR